MKNKVINREFIFKIILPTFLVFSIFTTLIFAVIIPSIKDYMLDGKREMIKELTNSVWSVLDEFEKEVADSIFTFDDAQNHAIKRIKNIRYGEQSKDYFWITDKHPNMIMHPYRSELNGTDLSNYEDPTGKKLFVEFVNKVKSSGDGFVDYMWQWKDDSTKIVPKLSYVKSFEPWGWIIGTGIYIEDVNEEISSISSRLFYISFGILILLGFILFFISKQSLLIERKRYDAEMSLVESEAKYKALVEASTDGLVMMLDGTIIYSNNAMLSILGYEKQNISNINFVEIFYNNNIEQTTGTKYFTEIASGTKPKEQYSAQLKKKDGTIIDVIFYTSNISLGGKSGYTIIVKDVSTHKKIEAELDLNKEKYLTLANTINIGVFRAKWDVGNEIVEANLSVAKAFGYDNPEELYSLNLFDFFNDKLERKNFTEKLKEANVLSDYIIRLKNRDGSISSVSISAVLIKDSDDNPIYIDGTIEDITERIKLDEERENLIVELQTSLRFLNQPIGHYLKHFVECDMHMPINKVAKVMTKQKYSAALIKTESGEFVGIVTDHDLRKRVISESYNLNNPIYEVMSSPLITISTTALVFEAFIMMNDNATRHLAVKDIDNKIVGIISSEELVTVQRHSTSYLLSEIERAESVEELISAHNKLPRLIKVLIDSGARSTIIAHIITSIFEAITEKLILYAINELGEPPVEFAFVALGSVGREEQTLISDQDNAIIYEDVEEELEESVHKYFHDLGTKICDWLNDCGYVYCPGEAMAKNPKWCQSISKWEKYFHTWITNSDQQDLIDLSIFFDFRCIYGATELTDQLREHLFKTAEGQSGFFQHLAKNSILHKPPVGLLGNIVVESKGEHHETFDIKSAITPISDFARIYALKNKVNNSNSIERLDSLSKKGVINSTTYEELKQAYNYIMQQRIKHQVEQIMESGTADNYINPSSLTHIEQKTLKNIFTQLLSIQKKLNYEFTGEAL